MSLGPGRASHGVEGVRRTTTVGSALYAFSSNGSLVYVAGPSAGNLARTTLAWTTTTGAVERRDVPAGLYETPRIAPDGHQAAVTNTDSSGSNVWIVDLSGARAMRRLTFGGRNTHAVWSPRGDHIVFQSDRGGDLGIYSQRADGSGPAEPLTKAPRGVAQIPESWAPDGKHLLLPATDGTEVTLWTYSLENGKTELFGDVRSTQPTNAVFSPDGRWVAYGSLAEDGMHGAYLAVGDVGSAWITHLTNLPKGTFTTGLLLRHPARILSSRLKVYPADRSFSPIQENVLRCLDRIWGINAFAYSELDQIFLQDACIFASQANGTGDSRFRHSDRNHERFGLCRHVLSSLTGLDYPGRNRSAD